MFSSFNEGLWKTFFSRLESTEVLRSRKLLGRGQAWHKPVSVFLLKQNKSGQLWSFFEFIKNKITPRLVVTLTHLVQFQLLIKKQNDQDSRESVN